MSSDLQREAVLLQNELLREPRFRDVRETLRRCCICLQNRCANPEECRQELARWAAPKWDALVPPAREREPSADRWRLMNLTGT